MKTNIVKIGNSKGVRIPKVLLEESGMTDKVYMKQTSDGILISPVNDVRFDEGILLSYSALAKEWDTPEEDEAWAYLQ
ncbi:MAG: AbrB/MazE/SpoVT family DNA-binding domain-containing protein [Patescibacteria group bacterium]